MAGQEAAQALSGLAGKVNIAQGADNAGKVMTVGADGNLAPADIPAQPSDGIVWDKSIGVENAEVGQYNLVLNVGQLTPGHYRFYLKSMLSYGGSGPEPLYLPFTSAIDFNVDVDTSQFGGSVSPVLDTNTVLSDAAPFPTEFVMDMRLDVYVNNTDKKLYFVSSYSPYYSTWVDQGLDIPDLFQVSKIKNLDTGEEQSVESLNYSTTAQPPEGSDYFSSLVNSGIQLSQVIRNTKVISQLSGTGTIYDVASFGVWNFINPEQAQQYSAINSIAVGFGEILVCLMERKDSTNEVGDTLVMKLTLTPTKAEYERIYSSGKFANWKPFLEKYEKMDSYSKLTIRAYDKSPIQLSDGYSLICLISYYGQNISSELYFDTHTDELDTFDTYEIPEKESAQALPDQTGNAGKFLTTDGTNASWGEVQATAITTDATLTGSGTADSPLGIAATVPAQTGTFVLKCIDGTLTWVAETTEA